MARTQKAADTVDAGGFVDCIGKFHLHIDQVFDGEDSKGKVFAGLFVMCTAITSDAKDKQDGKKLTMRLRDGQPGHKDGGEFCNRIQTAFLIASGLIAPSQLGKEISFEPTDAEGAQVLAKVAMSKGDDGKEYFELDGAHVYHVDDPRASGYPKDERSLSLIAKEHRHDAAYFEPITGKGKGKGGSAGGNGSGNGSQQKAAASADVADLL